MQFSPRSVLLPCILVIAALAAACGGDDDEATTVTSTSAPTATVGPTSTTDASGAPFDPCSVLGTEEAGEALGEPVVEGVRSDDPTLVPPSYRCDWIAVGDTSQAPDLVSVEGVPGDQATLDDYYADLGDAPEVPDLGLRAHYDDIFGLEVMMDGYIAGVTVITSDFDDAAIQERTIELGRLIVPRLPE